MTGIIDKCKAFTRQFEGSVPWMYLDTLGNVSVGTGHLVATSNDAADLNMLDKLDHLPACEQEKRDDYSRVLRSERNHHATFYRTMTHTIMPDSEIDRLFTQDLTEKYNGIHSKIIDLPEPAVIALVDMAFQFGARGLLTKWPEMWDRIGRGMWFNAAVQSHSSDVSTERNVARHDLIAKCGGK